MNKIGVTQLFPFLLPVRVMQRKICFYAGMHFDGHRYAKTVKAAFKFPAFVIFYQQRRDEKWKTSKQL